MSGTSIQIRAVNRVDIWPVGAIAGLLGGVAEIGWIALYQGVAGHESLAVARGVTQSLIPQLAATPAAAPLGIAFHMTLAVLLGTAIAFFAGKFLPQIVGTRWEPVIVVGMLVGVWAMNFFVILPAINPGFVALVPYGVSFVSKVLFGFAAAFIFWSAGRRRAASQ
jgi:hypothetical protein